MKPLIITRDLYLGETPPTKEFLDEALKNYKPERRLDKIQTVILALAVEKVLLNGSFFKGEGTYRIRLVFFSQYVSWLKYRIIIEKL